MELKIYKPEKADSIILTSKNPEYSSILIGCDTMGISNGFLTKDKRRAFYTGKTELVEELVKEYNLKEGSKFPVEGKIIILESTTPFFEGQEPKKNPSNGETMTFEGALIYRQQILVDINDPRTDEKLVADSTSTNNKINTLATEAAKSFSN